ncbi:MAG: macrolide ABC transporter ATP-binding protein, partial [Oscillospiraceae bacterium]
LRRLYKEGTTIILITHDNGIAATIPRVVRISDGVIVSDEKQEVDWL